MTQDPRSERLEVMGFLERLSDALVDIRTKLAERDRAAEVPIWADAGHFYLEAALGGMRDQLDVCVHDGRLFVAVTR